MSVKSYATPAGKEIQIIRNEQGNFKIQFATGGELPLALSGYYTLFNIAEQDVLKFIASKEAGRGKTSK